MGPPPTALGKKGGKINPAPNAEGPVDVLLQHLDSGWLGEVLDEQGEGMRGPGAQDCSSDMK